MLNVFKSNSLHCYNYIHLHYLQTEQEVENNKTAAHDKND